MANVIYRGPVDRQPRSINLPITSAALPGALVKRVGETLVEAAAGDVEGDLMILSNAEFLGQDIATAYASGDTAVAYVAEPQQDYQGRMAAATYAVGDLLTVGASGRFAAASAGDLVYARFNGTAGAVSAGDLADIIVANSFVMAA